MRRQTCPVTLSEPLPVSTSTAFKPADSKWSTPCQVPRRLCWPGDLPSRGPAVEAGAQALASPCQCGLSASEAPALMSCFHWEHTVGGQRGASQRSPHLLGWSFTVFFQSSCKTTSSTPTADLSDGVSPTFLELMHYLNLLQVTLTTF